MLQLPLIFDVSVPKIEAITLDHLMRRVMCMKRPEAIRRPWDIVSEHLQEQDEFNLPTCDLDDILYIWLAAGDKDGILERDAEVRLSVAVYMDTPPPGWQTEIEFPRSSQCCRSTVERGYAIKFHGAERAKRISDELTRLCSFENWYTTFCDSGMTEWGLIPGEGFKVAIKEIK